MELLGFTWRYLPDISESILRIVRFPPSLVGTGSTDRKEASNATAEDLRLHGPSGFTHMDRRHLFGFGSGQSLVAERRSPVMAQVAYGLLPNRLVSSQGASVDWATHAYVYAA